MRVVPMPGGVLIWILALSLPVLLWCAVLVPRKERAAVRVLEVGRGIVTAESRFSRPSECVVILNPSPKVDYQLSPHSGVDVGLPKSILSQINVLFGDPVFFRGINDRGDAHRNIDEPVVRSFSGIAESVFGGSVLNKRWRHPVAAQPIVDLCRSLLKRRRVKDDTYARSLFTDKHFDAVLADSALASAAAVFFSKMPVCCSMWSAWRWMARNVPNNNHA